MEEVWLPVVGYEGFYFVNNKGSVKNRYGRYISLGKTGDGYPIFIACVKNRKKPVLVHRAMMEAFVPNHKETWHEINHKDYNPSNNFIFINPDGSVDLEKSNLEWCTHKYNMQNRKKYGKEVSQYTADGIFVKNWVSASEAASILGIQQSKISACCRGKRKTTGGFKWKYIEK